MSGHSRAVVTYLQLRLASDDRYNESFLYYFSSKRLNKENGGLLLKGKDELVTAGNKYSRGTECCLYLSLCEQDSPKHLCLEADFKENY